MTWPVQMHTVLLVMMITVQPLLFCPSLLCFQKQACIGYNEKYVSHALIDTRLLNCLVHNQPNYHMSEKQIQTSSLNWYFLKIMTV